MFKKIWKFLIAIIIAFGIGMVVIIPSMKQLSGKMNFDMQLILIDWDKIRLFINVIFNNYIYMFTQKSCFIFSSTFTLFLVPMYYFNSNISKKEKISFTCIVLFLLFPIVSPFFNKLWHAFTTPNCFNYRYSFTLIFTLIIMAFREYQNKSFTKKSSFYFSGIIFCVLTIIEIVLNNKGYLKSDGYSVNLSSIYLSCIVYIIMFVLTYIIYFIKSNKFKNIAISLLITIVIMDLLIGARSGQNNNDKYFKREIVTQYDEFMEYFMKKIEVPEIERIVFVPDKYGSNMSLKYGYSNIGFFSSARNRDILKSMYRLGYNVQMEEQLWITSYSGTFLNYSIAGVKYYITKQQLEDNIYGFELDEIYKDFYIYKNKNNFNIGYYLEDNTIESYNPFIIQNDFLNKLIYNNDQSAYFENIDTSDSIECNKNIEYINETGEYKINYKVKGLKDCSIYLASDYNIKLYINGNEVFEHYSNIWSTETGIKQVKHLNENEEFEFTITTKQNLETMYIYVSDNNKIQLVLDDKDKQNYFGNVNIYSNGLDGIAHFKNEGFLVFAINYDKNWNVYVDGKKVNTTNVAGAFLGVRLESGVHKVEVKFEL